MAKIVATYSPCCGIFRVGNAEQGVMHCALPHDRKVVKLVDEKELDILKILEEKAEEAERIRMEHERKVRAICRRFWLSMLLLAVVSLIALLA